MPFLRRLPRLPLAARFIAPLVLVLVAAVQITLVRTQDLNPWVGGGFGMFAEVDKRAIRAVRVYAETPAAQPVALDVRGFAETSEGNEKLLSRVISMPDDAALRAMGAAMAKVEWTPEGQIMNSRTAAAERPLRLGDLRLEVHKLAYDSARLQARPELLSRLEVRS